MANPAAFWNFIARRYARSPVADEAAYRQKLDVTQRYFDADTNVLEIGCGTGTTALKHAPLVRHLRAIDFSANMIEIAEQKRLDAGIHNVTFECCAVDDLDDPPRSYDVVLGLSILHLLPQWLQAITTVTSLLKPGGVFVSSTACLGDSMAWFRYVAPAGRALGVLPSLAVFGASDLRAALIGAGLELEHDWTPGKNKAVFIVARKPHEAH